MVKTQELILVETGKAQVKGSFTLPLHAYTVPVNGGGIANIPKLLDILVTPLSTWGDSTAAVLTIDYNGLSSPFTFNVKTLTQGDSVSVLDSNSGVLHQPELSSGRAAPIYFYVDATAQDGSSGATRITIVYDEPDADPVVVS